ncbi:MAG: excalibur calcium-binding domain-containing protein [Methylococcales bacterium]
MVALFVYSFDKYSHNNTPNKIATIAAVATQSSIDEATSPSFRCDGRTHCSQMTSCNEAKYFLRNCPNVEMDGDNDGEPCETQWCTYPFSQ